ncbi:MAG: hypothetical protein KAS49_06630, partial [Candidatus Cloacimonetes bacterium]|nr:hypothetical protein [Candidatus Cloacimonadota bacterium]
TYMASSISTVIPSVLTAEGTHYSTPFWINKDGDYSIIGSNNLTIYMKWGYKGEYESDDPNNKKNDEVQDELTKKPYFSEIRFFDLRLDGEAYHYAPLSASENNVLDEKTGKEWLRVPMSSSISNGAILTDLDFGLHKFEVRTVDLQGVADATPDEFVFEIIETTPKSEKSGILIINDDKGFTNTPSDIVDPLYEGFVADYAGDVDVFYRVKSTANSLLHFLVNTFSPTDLQKYKLIIYHADDPNNNNFHSEYDAMNLYLNGGGNLIVSGAASLKTSMLVGSKDKGYPLLPKYFGLPLMEEDAILCPSGADDEEMDITNFDYLSYFVNAIKEDSMPTDINLKLPGFNAKMNEFNGYAPLAYFTEDLLLEGTDVIFRFGCKEAADEPLDPTLDEYKKYTGQPVAIRKVTDNNSCYMFGFPLSYMEPLQVKEVLNHIIKELDAGNGQ